MPVQDYFFQPFASCFVFQKQHFSLSGARVYLVFESSRAALFSYDHVADNVACFDP